MADPIQDLVDAARRSAERINRCCGDYSEMQGIAENLFDALAAYDAAQAQPVPTDAEIEAAATVCVEAINAVLPDEPLDELSNIFTLETKRAHWERLVDARDRLALIARLRGGA